MPSSSDDNKRVEVPPWLAALWFFGPYSFALLIIVISSTKICTDMIIIFALMLEQTLAILYSPKLNSIGGGLMVSLSIISLVILWRGMSCGPIRSMITMELVMNGGFRYIHLLGDEKLRNRSFAHRIAFVTIFSSIQTSILIDYKQAWKEGKKIIVSVIIAAVSGIGSYYCISTVLPVQITSQQLLFPMRIFFGGMLIYSCLTIIDGIYRCSLLFAQPLGILCETAMDRPYNSNSFGIFWSKKWDRPMQSILYYGVFQPLRKSLGCSMSISIFSVFLVSGGIHTLGVAACGWISFRSCMMMMSFFIVQAVFVLIEGSLKIVPGMVATQTMIWISSPLFVVPFLEMLKI